MESGFRAVIHDNRLLLETKAGKRHLTGCRRARISDWSEMFPGRFFLNIFTR
jgi:hypothetical protein